MAGQVHQGTSDLASAEISLGEEGRIGPAWTLWRSPKLVFGAALPSGSVPRALAVCSEQACRSCARVVFCDKAVCDAAQMATYTTIWGVSTRPPMMTAPPLYELPSIYASKPSESRPTLNRNRSG